MFLEICIPFDLRIRRILLPTAHRCQFIRRTKSQWKSHTRNNLHLGDTMAISEDNTDLRGCGALLGQLADLVHNLIRCRLEPGRCSARVRNSGGTYAFTVAMKATHDGERVDCQGETVSKSSSKLQVLDFVGWPLVRLRAFIIT